MAIIAKQVDFLLNGYKDPTTGALLNGGKVKTYLDGTTTLSSVWTDRGKTSDATNPIILDSAGRAEVYADGVYKFEIYDASDNLLETINGLDYSIITENKISIGDYGGNLAAAIADIGLSEATLLIDQIVTITADATVPSNISLEKTRGGMFTGAFTLTINGGMTGDMDSAWFDVNVIPAISQVELPVSIFYSFHQALVGIGSNHTELTLNQLSTLTQDETVLTTTNLKKSITSTAFTGAYTLTINGGMTGDMFSQWFDSSVTVAGSPKITEVYPEMFGAKGDGVTNDTIAVQSSIDFFSKVVLKNSYGIITTLTKDVSGFKLFGVNEQESSIIPLAGFSGDVDSDGNFILLNLGNGTVSRYFNEIRNIGFKNSNSIPNITAIYFNRVNNQSKIVHCNFKGLERGFEFINLSLANIVYANKFRSCVDICRLTGNAGNSTIISFNYLAGGRIYLNDSMTGVEIINNVGDSGAYVFSDGSSGIRGTLISGNRFESNDVSQPSIELGFNRTTRIDSNFFTGSGIQEIAIDLVSSATGQNASITNNSFEGIVTSFVRSALLNNKLSVFNNKYNTLDIAPTTPYDTNRLLTTTEGTASSDKFLQVGDDIRYVSKRISTFLSGGLSESVFTLTTDGTRGNYSVAVKVHLSFDANSTAVAVGNAKYSFCVAHNNIFSPTNSSIITTEALNTAANAPTTRDITGLTASIANTTDSVLTFSLNPTLVGVGSVEAIVEITVSYAQYAKDIVIDVV